jgi:hypothetical protein
MGMVELHGIAHIKHGVIVDVVGGTLECII